MNEIKGKITRRDFLNAVLLGSGALLLDWPAPVRLLAQQQTWQGYGGVGDYAASHGNTEEIARVWGELQRGKYRTASETAEDTGEIFDLVVVGGGLSGLGAAYEFKRTARDDQRCLILENHPEAHRSEGGSLAFGTTLRQAQGRLGKEPLGLSEGGGPEQTNLKQVW